MAASKYRVTLSELVAGARVDFDDTTTSIPAQQWLPVDLSAAQDTHERPKLIAYA